MQRRTAKNMPAGKSAATRAARARPQSSKHRTVRVAADAPPVRKLVAFDPETWGAIDLLARDSMLSWQELADEAFRDLLKKHGRPDTLQAALKKSARDAVATKRPPG